MARIIVTADPMERGPRGTREDMQPVLLDERVSSIHLRDGHSAEQLMQRLAWAVGDAERSEQRT